MKTQAHATIKVSVSNVKIQDGTTRRVRFTARPKAVTIRSKGLTPIKVRKPRGLGASNKFEAFAKNDPTTIFVGKTPARAFANAVKSAWA